MTTLEPRTEIALNNILFANLFNGHRFPTIVTMRRSFGLETPEVGFPTLHR